MEEGIDPVNELNCKNLSLRLFYSVRLPRDQGKEGDERKQTDIGGQQGFRLSQGSALSAWYYLRGRCTKEIVNRVRNKEVKKKRKKTNSSSSATQSPIDDGICPSSLLSLRDLWANQDGQKTWRVKWKVKSKQFLQAVSVPYARRDGTGELTIIQVPFVFVSTSVRSWEGKENQKVNSQ